MSEQNYFNRTDRKLFPIVWPTHVGPVDDRVIEKALNVTVAIAGLTSPPTWSRVLYTTQADNGFYTVDGGGSLIMTRTGLYSVTIITGFSDSELPGARNHYLGMDRNGTQKVFGFQTSASTELGFATELGTSLCSTITLPLNEGDILEHKVAVLSPLGPSALIGTDDSGVSYTRVIMVHIQ